MTRHAAQRVEIRFCPLLSSFSSLDRRLIILYRLQHIMIDLGTGNNNKINWPMEDKQEMIDIIETVYRGASKGRG